MFFFDKQHVHFLFYFFFTSIYYYNRLLVMDYGRVSNLQIPVNELISMSVLIHKSVVYVTDGATARALHLLKTNTQNANSTALWYSTFSLRF